MKLFWKFYSILFLIIAITNLIIILDSSSINHQFYFITAQFNQLNIFYYWANIALIVLTILSSFIVIAFAFNQQISFLNASLILILRIIFEIFGNNYNFLIIQSSLYVNNLYAISTICQIFIIPYAASYFAHYQYIKKLNKIN